MNLETQKLIELEKENEQLQELLQHYKDLLDQKDQRIQQQEEIVQLITQPKELWSICMFFMIFCNILFLEYFKNQIQLKDNEIKYLEKQLQSLKNQFEQNEKKVKYPIFLQEDKAEIIKKCMQKMNSQMELALREKNQQIQNLKLDYNEKEIKMERKLCKLKEENQQLKKKLNFFNHVSSLKSNSQTLESNLNVININ